jgi:hypothetical protein
LPGPNEAARARAADRKAAYDHERLETDFSKPVTASNCSESSKWSLW